MIALDEFLAEWRWARQLSLSVLELLPNDTFTAQPVPTAGPWWKQFRHLGRVQENYIQALHSGHIRFTSELGTYSDGPNRQALTAYLEQVDKTLIQTLQSSPLPTMIDWFGVPTSLQLHLTRLLAHETLHHGQFITYARISGLQLPECWNAWGEG